MSRYAATGLLALLAATFRLWLPSEWTGTQFYPGVPMLDLPSVGITAVNLLTMPVMVVAALALLALDRDDQNRLRCIAWFSIAIAIATAFATDQHRLQPWAYQMALYAVLFVLVPTSRVVGYLRVLTISIYAFSSLGKFDYQFLHTVGQDFLQTAMGFVGVQVENWDDSIRTKLAAGFPAFELLTAIMLAIPQTRRFGGVLAIAMHAGLLILLSPWAMAHSAGVLMWNLFLAGQAYLLFCQPHLLNEKESIAATDSALNEQSNPLPITDVQPWRTRLAGGLVALAIILPLTERRGRQDADRWHWDHWLSWALYSPHNSRVHAEVHRNTLSEMPSTLRKIVLDDRDGDGWHSLDLDQWSLTTRRVPILPQARYQLLLAGELARANDWNRQIRCVLKSASDRFDGTRRETWLPDLRAMQEAESEFWLSEVHDTDSGEGQ